MADETTGDSSSGVEKFKTYMRTRKGMILAVEIVRHAIFHMICINYIYMYIFISIYMCVGVCMRVAYLSKVCVCVCDLIRAVIGALLFLITSLISVIGGGDGARIAGGVFGLLAAVLFSYDSYISYLAIKTSKHTPTATDVNDDV
ncbi:proteolipid protein 2-like [Huso huso]|uniref:Proteolipid protein 2-like n=1 Tax=Huso huso TaxID=61971 RepID=A0ABR0Y3W1_HUSHU